MGERITKMMKKLNPIIGVKRLSKLRKRPMLLAVGATVGFMAVLASQLTPPDPESRLPDQYRLAALIQRQQNQNEEQRQEVERIRSDVESLRLSAASQRGDISAQNQELDRAGSAAGLTPLKGPGFTVTLNDSSLESAPTGNVNDLVIHSQDVQAVVNGLWSAGAEAISINGQRLVSTSAVLCVGNTLLINGTVHSPPYNVSAIGANKDKYSSDRLVRSVRDDAERFSLGYSVGKDTQIDIPGYSGSTNLEYAKSTAPK